MSQRREPPQTFRELLQRYQQGEREFADSVLDADPDNDLSGVCLDGVDLSDSEVIAIFRGASLRGARFVAADVRCCDFRDADLRGADFTEAVLCATEWSGSKLDGARFARAAIHSYRFKEDEQPHW